MTDINQKIEDLEAAFVSLEATLVSLKAKAKAQQEPTLTPVSFESKSELAKALMAGRTFITPAGTTLMYSEEIIFGDPFRIMRDGKDRETMRDIWNLYADLEEINAAPAEPWYLNIPPEGVECYVSGRNPNPSCATRIIFFYNLGYCLPFRCSDHVGWKYATPVNGGK